MNEKYQAKNFRNLTLKDLSTYEDKLKSTMDIATFETEQDLIDNDYVIGNIEMEVNGNLITYTFIHGFPGDNPEGVLFNDTGIYMVGENCEGDSDIHKWYNEILENGNYDKPFWYAVA